CLDLPGDRADVPHGRRGRDEGRDTVLAAQRRLPVAGRPRPPADDLGGPGPCQPGVDEHLPEPGRGPPARVRAARANRWTIMSTDHGFTSVFAAQLDEYLAFKEAMGFHGASRVWYLRKFDAWCAEHDRTTFDQDTVEGWVT